MIRSELPRTVALTLFALLAACGAPPEAPSPRQGTALTLGQPTEGVLRDTTPTYGERGRFHLYHFQGEEGRHYAVDLRSPNFDTYLVVGDRAHGLFSPIGFDDDGGGDLDSHLAFTAPRTGTYLVVAQALASTPDAIGLYTVEVRELGEPRPAEPVAITSGESRGELTYDDPVVPGADAQVHDLYTFDAEAGQRYVITLASDDFDTYLAVGPMRGDSLEVIRENDDGAAGTNSRLVFAPGSSGTFGIRVRPYGTGLGAYTVRLDTAADAGSVTSREIAAGQRLSGRLESSDPILDDGSYYDVFGFTGEAGETIVVSLSSDDFDTFLTFGRPPADDMVVLETNDDGGEGVNAELTFTLPESGRYLVRVQSWSSGEGGAYEIALRHR